ncbi:MAG TPA: ATP-dependent sacrificial sulfur transferase LarE [Anaerolineales bacterium]|nr:ATP-dependent sacrificial sulfur transferase LarE [Anaerolineales bacterium]
MLNEKYQKLKDILTGMESVLVAFSGGTDSSLLLKVAHDVLGDKAIAITAVSASLAASERTEAMQIAALIGARHILLESGETSDPDYLSNTPNRCFFCKKETFGKLAGYAQQHGIRFLVDGTNADDTGDYRPGRKAALQFHVRSPLLEAGLTKAEIRSLSHELGLPNWDKPAAACLSSRIPYGTAITLEALSQVERAEAMLHGLGLRQLRVRHHGPVARIEVEPEDFPRLLEHRNEIITRLKAIGYTFVSLDLAGFHSGSLNAGLPDAHAQAG